MRKLFIVESPNKISKIRGFLDRYEPGQWRVVATVGHWRGLPEMDGQSFEDVADPDAAFRESFVIHESKKKVASDLQEALRSADEIYLATDADREGEAIAWHINDHFKLKSSYRVLANEITEQGIINAIKSAGKIDENLVDAQRTRALIDYLIGMDISRALWRFGAKSAGRLQSCALRILVDRETQIRNFRPEKFWKLLVDYLEGFSASIGTFEKPSQDELDADENSSDEPRFSPKRFNSEDEAQKVLGVVRSAVHTIHLVEQKPAVRKPPPPFTTADLLGTAALRLHLDSAQTTKIAQALFEKGVVTYIRTDSVVVSDEAITAIRSYLGAHHPSLLPDEPQKAKESKNAQAAHEAIRPTKMTKIPGADLNQDETLVYDLIFERTLISQAKPAIFDRTTVTIALSGCDYHLQTTGTSVRQLGWLELDSNRSVTEKLLPNLEIGQKLNLKRADLEAGTTKPPPRFNERSLIRYLDRHGVGRPSTYANMIATLKNRTYIEERDRSLAPSELGETADHLVRLGFDELSKVDFTANTELGLDGIAKGRIRRERFLAQFHRHFRDLESKAKPLFDAFSKAHPELDRTSETPHASPCPKCGGAMTERRGQSGRYAKCISEGCGQALSLEPPKLHKIPCPDCTKPVEERQFTKDGQRQRFFACQGCPWKSKFPPPKVGKQPCPTCGFRTLLRGKAEKRFWGCGKYPECSGSLPFRVAS